MIKKKCLECGEIKSLGLFYKKVSMADGHLNKCKDCTKKRVSANYFENMKDPDFVNRERIRSRERYRSLPKRIRDPDFKKKYQGKWLDRFPEKRMAQSVVRRKYKLKGYQRHHWSYNEEHYLDIIHLSEKDHKKAHRFLIYDQERFMYRGVDNVLLDTKEKHLKYINFKILNEED